MTASDGRHYHHDIYVSPNGTLTLVVTLSGLAVGAVGNWACKVVAHDYDAPAAAVVSPAVTVDSGANTVTVTFTATNNLATLSSGQAKFVGRWLLYNTSVPLDLIGGKYTCERNGVASTSTDTLTLTVTSTSITASITNALPYSTLFKSLAKSLEELIEGTITRDANEAVTTAGVVWPDGTTGTFTATSLSTLFPGAVDAYTVTYAHPSGTVTYTQPLMTRDSSGAVTVRPAMTIS